MLPFISIIIPVYNNETYFPIAVKSVLEQSYSNWEIVIIDDGSTDKTSEIADEFVKIDSRIQVIHQDNQWIYASLNKGISLARGKYIFVLNSDDQLCNNALQTMANLAQQYKTDIIWTKILRCRYSANRKDEVNIVKDVNFLVIKDEVFQNQESVRNNWIWFEQCNLTCNQINLYRTEIAQSHLFRTDFFGADRLFNIDIASDIHSAVICSKPIYQHFIYESNEMNASIGKYYGYEHEMYNEFFEKNVELLKSWGKYDEKSEGILMKNRLNNFTVEVRSLGAFNCPLLVEEKIAHIFENSLDQIVYTCASATKGIEELESRVLSGIRELLYHNVLSMESNYYFVYELLESLLRYEKSEDDMEKIQHAVYHKRNPYHIGESFLKKLL